MQTGHTLQTGHTGYTRQTRQTRQTNRKGIAMLAEIFGMDGVVVLVVIAVVLFGGTQIPKLARSLGTAKSEFRRGLTDPSPPTPTWTPGTASGVGPADAAGGITVLLLSPPKLMVLLIALIVLGPDKLPGMARRMGALWSDFHRWRSHLEREVRRFPDLPSTAEIARAIRSPLSMLDPLAHEHGAQSGGDAGRGRLQPRGAGETGVGGSGRAVGATSRHPTCRRMN